jgi:hypothetical protein
MTPKRVGSATMKTKTEEKRANKPLPMSQGSGFVHFDENCGASSTCVPAAFFGKITNFNNFFTKSFVQFDY